MWSLIVRTSSPGSADRTPRPASPLVGGDDQAGKGLGGEGRRLLRHDVTIRRDRVRGERGDRRGTEQKERDGSVASAVEPIQAAGHGLREGADAVFLLDP